MGDKVFGDNLPSDNHDELLFYVMSHYLIQKHEWNTVLAKQSDQLSPAVWPKGTKAHMHARTHKHIAAGASV